MDPSLFPLLDIAGGSLTFGKILVEIIRFVVGLLGPEAKPVGNHWRKPGDQNQSCAWKTTFLQTSVLTLLQLSYLLFSSDPEHLDLLVQVGLIRLVYTLVSFCWKI